MAIIDFMSYAKGAEMADQANWRDAMEQMRLDTQQEALRQSQQKFDLAYGQAVTNTTEQLDMQKAMRETTARLTQIDNELAGVPPEAKGSAYAQRLQMELARLNPEDPTYAARTQALQKTITNAMGHAYRNRDAAGVQALAAILPGVSANAPSGTQISAALQWQDPSFYNNVENLKAAGAVVQPDGRVATADGIVFENTAQYAEFQRQRALGQNMNPQLQQLMTAQQLRTGNTALLDQLRAANAANGIGYVVNPVTGQYQMVRVPQATEATGFAPGVSGGGSDIRASRSVAPAAVAAPMAPAAAPMAPAAAPMAPFNDLRFSGGWQDALPPAAAPAALPAAVPAPQAGATALVTPTQIAAATEQQWRTAGGLLQPGGAMQQYTPAQLLQALTQPFTQPLPVFGDAAQSWGANKPRNWLTSPGR